MKLRISGFYDRWVMIRKLSMGRSGAPDFMLDLVFAPFIEYELLNGKKSEKELR